MPPTVDVSLSEMTRLLLPLAPLMHLCFSMWMFSNTDIFQHVRTHTLPSTSFHSLSKLLFFLLPRMPDRLCNQRYDRLTVY